MPALVYDTGALLATERGSHAMAALHRQATAAVVTSDPDDLHHLADATPAKLAIHPI
jgi:hypothetical protein